MTMTTTSTITLTTPDGPMTAYEAIPEGPPKGGVVVVQEAFGVTTHIEDVARRFADAGWRAIAPAFFHRQGSPVLSYDDIASVMPIMGGLTGDGLAMDLRAAFEHLRGAGLPTERVAVVGFCMGGTVTFYAATLEPVGAAVTFYGGGVAEGRWGLPSLIDQAPTLQAPWLGLFGDRDASIPVDHVEQLRSATDEARPDTAIVRYPEAQHGFHCDDRPAVFDAEAAKDAWDRTLDWLGTHITPQGSPT
jgi:carboxymethylenebutenolidase